MPGIKYQRLTRERSARTFAAFTHTRSSLWLGDDHLLLIESNGFSESYKRFFFRDIQAITIQRTARRKVWNWVLGIPLIICTLLIIFGLFDVHKFEAGVIIFYCVIFLVFGIPLIFNNLFGTTCVCQIRTAVQTENVPSLCRLPKTRKILEKVRPFIAAAQGQFKPEEVATRLREQFQPAPVPDNGAPPVLS